MSIDTSSQSSHTGSTAVVNDGEFMLFGVRVRVDPMRKSVSLNDLSQYELPHQESPIAAAGDVPAAGYASADDAVHHQPSGGSRERKRGVPWTEEEHKMFLLGLQRVGKGDWRGISRNFVKTRTPTQVASHAQKYFLRRSNLNRRRRRSSLFDITTESVTPVPMEEKVHQEHKVQPLLSPLAETSIINGPQVFSMNMCPISMPAQTNNSTENFTFRYSGHINHHQDSAEIVHQVPSQRRMIDLNLNQRLSEDPSALSLSLSLSLDRVKSSFNNGDSLISVA